MALCSRIVDKYVADVEVAKKCFYVPATSLEALSAIRRRCQGMEALFSRFHVSDVCIRVVWSGRGCRLGYGGCAAEVECGGRVFVARVDENEKKPCKHWFTGLIVVYTCSCTSLYGLLPVCSPSRVTRRCGVSHREIQTKKTQIEKEGGPRPPHIVARVNFCHLDRKICR